MINHPNERASPLVSEKTAGKTPVYVAGEGPAAVLAAYAALLEAKFARVILHDPPMTHMDANAPQFLNVLRVCDTPAMIGMLAPRPFVIHSNGNKEIDKITRIYQAAGAAANLIVK